MKSAHKHFVACLVKATGGEKIEAYKAIILKTTALVGPTIVLFEKAFSLESSGGRLFVTE